MASPHGILSLSRRLRRLSPPLRFSLAGSRLAAPRVLIQLLLFVPNDDYATSSGERGRLARAPQHDRLTNYNESL